MVRLTARHLRAGTVPVLGLLVVALCLGSARAQFNPPPQNPFMPPGGPQQPGGFNGRMPGMGGPLFENVWTCGKCGREIGRGNFPPATCPYCGVRLINGIGPADPKYNNGNQPAPNNGAMMPPNNPNPGMMPGMMPPNNQNSGQVPPNGQPNNPNPGVMPGMQPNDPAGPQGGVQAQGAPVPPPGPAVMPPAGNDPPGLEDPPAAENVAAGGLGADTRGATAPGSRLPLPVRVFIGFAALLAAMVVLVVGGIVVYNLAVNNSVEPVARPRKRRRLAEVD